MADTLAQVQKDVRFWQRLLTFAGYKPGKVDGVNGRKTKAAAQEWQNDAERIKSEIGSFDERSERNLATLTPEAQQAARIWLKAAKAVADAEGYDVRIICGTRTYAEQDELYRKRPRVTKARGGQSMHNFGIAWDIGIFRGKEYIGDHVLYAKVGKLYNQVPGIAWGGTWKSFVDEPHYQLEKYSSSSAARNAFEV